MPNQSYQSSIKLSFETHPVQKEGNRQVTRYQTEIKSIIQKTLPPKEGIFFDDQVFDAYSFVSELIKSAKKSIVLIDNYIDDYMKFFIALPLSLLPPLLR